MSKSEIYVTIAVLLLLTIILVWFGLKTYLDMKKRNRRREQQRKEWQERMKNKH